MSQIIEILHAGWMGNLTSLGTLQSVAGLNNHEAAKLCGVASETYRRWRTDRTPPLYAFRLLSILAGYIPWAGWGKWFYNPFDKSLVNVDLKDGFYPSMLAEFIFLRQRYKQAAARESEKRGEKFPGYLVHRQGQGNAAAARRLSPLDSVPKIRQFPDLRAAPPCPVRAQPATTTTSAARLPRREPGQNQNHGPYWTVSITRGKHHERTDNAVKRNIFPDGQRHRDPEYRRLTAG